MSSPVDEVKKTNLECTNALGQLIRVNDPHLNQTWVYNYDRGGNILSKVRYAFTTGALDTALETIPYAYGDAIGRTSSPPTTARPLPTMRLAIRPMMAHGHLPGRQVASSRRCPATDSR